MSDTEAFDPVDFVALALGALLDALIAADTTPANLAHTFHERLGARAAYGLADSARVAAAALMDLVEALLDELPLLGN